MSPLASPIHLSIIILNNQEDLMLLCPTPCSMLNCSLSILFILTCFISIRNSIITFPNQYSTSYLDKMFYNSLSDMHSLNEQMHNKQYFSFHRFLSDWWKLCSTCTLSSIKLQDFVVVVTSSVLSVRILVTCFLTKSSSHKFFSLLVSPLSLYLCFKGYNTGPSLQSQLRSENLSNGMIIKQGITWSDFMTILIMIVKQIIMVTKWNIRSWSWLANFLASFPIDLAS